MVAQALKARRKQLGLTQKNAAERLGVSQPYWSLLEKGLRPLTPELASKAMRVMKLSPTVLPVSASRVEEPISGEQLARELAALGYPGFAYMKKAWKRNPAEVLLRALAQEGLEARLFEALPWLVLHYAEMDREWLVREARMRNLTNRLGFVVSLACEVAQKDGRASLLQKESLTALLTELGRGRLAQEEPFGQSAMTEAEQKWLREHRTENAKYWNLLTDWKAEWLQYAR